MKWETTEPPPLTPQQCKHYLRTEFAPNYCEGWRAEHITDAINAEFRRRIGWEREQPAGPLTTALALASFVASTVIVFGFLVWLVKG